MKNNPLLSVAVIAALMLACNLPVGASTQETATPLASETSPILLETPTPTETLTPLPSETPTITPTITPSVPMVTPLDEGVNCRFGPGTNYQQISALLVGAYTRILAKTADGSWWQVQNPSGGSDKCWVAASVVVASGDLNGIGVAPAPAAFVTDVKLLVKPDSIDLGLGCPGPAPVFSLKGTIYVNGPVEVKWHFETQKDGSLPSHTTNFTSFGSKDVSADYVPTVWDKDSYWVRLVITSPSNLVAEAKYQIKCS